MNRAIVGSHVFGGRACLTDRLALLFGARGCSVGPRLLRVVVGVVVLVALGGCGSSGRSVSGRSSTSATKTVQASSSADALSTLVAKTQGSVVRIGASTCDSKSVGTGFLIGRRLVATVEHVVDGAATITLKQGARAVATGTVIGEDTARDIALVQSSKPLGGAILPLATRAPQLGETVAALGFPLGLPLTVTQGSVSGLQRTIPINGSDRRNMVQTDAAVNPGNSGGPLLSVDSGQVVGLVDLGSNQANGIAFAVSAQVAQPLLQAWQVAPQPIATAVCANPSITSQPASAPSSGGSAAAFKVAFAAAKVQFQQLGSDMQAAVSGAASQTDAELATEFSGLSTRAADQASQLRALSPPPEYQSQLDQLASGFDAVSTDLQTIVTAADAHDGSAAHAAATALLQDAASVKRADDALTSALGLSPSQSAARGPGATLRLHLEDLGSGQYQAAFMLMSASYQAQNPSWVQDRSAANPGINVISIGAPRLGSGTAQVPADFYARDRRAAAGSDTRCRHIQGTASMVSEGGAWAYDPNSNHLTATVTSSADPNCP